MELTRSLRETMTVPILMLTARAEADSRIQGLEYRRRRLSRPSPSSRASCCSASTTSSSAAQPSGDAADRAVVRFGPFTFHREKLELKRGGEPVHLTDRERQIMAIFAAAPGETVPRTELIGSDGPSRRAHRRRPDQPPAPQDRGRPRQPALPPDRARHRLPPDHRGLRQDHAGAATRSDDDHGRGGHPADPRSPHRLAALRPRPRRHDAEGAVRPLADHHHRPGRAAPGAGRLRLHGASTGSR